MSHSPTFSFLFGRLNGLCRIAVAAFKPAQTAFHASEKRAALNGERASFVKPRTKVFDTLWLISRGDIKPTPAKTNG